MSVNRFYVQLDLLYATLFVSPPLLLNKQQTETSLKLLQYVMNFIVELKYFVSIICEVTQVTVIVSIMSIYSESFTLLKSFSYAQ